MVSTSKAAQSVRLKLYADYHQIHLLDDGARPDLATAWTVQATEDKLAVAEGGIGIGTQEADTVSIAVEIHAAEPAASKKADHITEGSLEIRSGRLVVLGCTDYLPDAKRIPVPPGWYRVRVRHAELAKKEKLTVALWPSPRADPRVCQRWVVAPPTRPQRSSKIKNAKQAAQAARRGRIDEAVLVLEQLADGGDKVASASLAEILAFQGKWAEFVVRAEAFFADPSVVYAGNVFSGHTRLFRRAARELGTPEIIDRAAAKVPERYQRMAQATLLKDIVPFSARIAEPTPQERQAFEAAVATARAGRRFAGHPKELAKHCFDLASGFHVESEVHRLWAELGDDLQFDDALIVARWHMFRQGEVEAWSVIEHTISRWWPVDQAQVAPVDLLVDPLLAPLLTPERCTWVLSQPKGPE
jgi:hypothetical protein